MALPEYSLKQLLESGVHFGHQTHRWNPLMEEYIYGVRNGIHIIDLTQTFSLLDAALNAVSNTVSKGGSVLFVGTKRQAQKPIAEAAEKCAQYYMNHRWLGGTLTNWKTVSNSISRLKKLDEQLSDGATGLTKKERLNLEREQSKLNSSLGGITEMGGLPDLLFVIDSNRESLAIQEAKNLKIPVIAILDTNSDPTGIEFPVPGNDDAARSISFYCDLVAKAALEGMTNQLTAAGVDIGESFEGTHEKEVQVSLERDKATTVSKNISQKSVSKEEDKDEEPSENKEEGSVSTQEMDVEGTVPTVPKVTKTKEENLQIDSGVGETIKTDDKKPEIEGNVADKIKDEVKEVIKPKALKQKTTSPTKEAKVKSDKLKETKSKKEPSDSGESSGSPSKLNKEKSEKKQVLKKKPSSKKGESDSEVEKGK